jgi:hypothetical protein
MGGGGADEMDDPSPDGPPYRVRGDHQALLAGLMPAVPYRLSGEAPPASLSTHGVVVVPAVRTAPALTSAIRVAEELSWHLLVICSHELPAVAVREMVRSSRAQVSLVSVD